MNRIQELDREALSRLAVRRVTRLILLIGLLHILLTGVLLEPLFAHFSSDVLFRSAWWLNLLGWLLDILDVAVFVVAYPMVVYALWRGGFRHGSRAAVAYTLITALKLVVDYLMTCLVDGALPSGEILLDDMELLLPSLLYELAQLWLVVLFACIHMSGWRKRQAPLTSDDPLPMTALFAHKNPVQRSLLDVGIVLLLFGLVRHAIYQLSLIVELGAPDPSLQILADLTGDLFIGVVAYLAGLLIVNKLHARYRPEASC